MEREIWKGVLSLTSVVILISCAYKYSFSGVCLQVENDTGAYVVLEDALCSGNSHDVARLQDLVSGSWTTWALYVASAASFALAAFIIPSAPPSTRLDKEYDKSEYWDKRYRERTQSFEWYLPYDAIKSTLEHHLNPRHDVLVLGGGNTCLSAAMLKTNCVRKVVSVDFLRSV